MFMRWLKFLFYNEILRFSRFGRAMDLVSQAFIRYRVFKAVKGKCWFNEHHKS